MAKDVDFTSLVVGGSVIDQELFFEEGFFTDGTPITQDELDRLANEHYDMLFDAAYNDAVGRAESVYEGER